MREVEFDVLLFDRENLFDVDIGDNQIRLDGLSGEELCMLLQLAKRTGGIHIACFPYLSEPETQAQ